MKLYALLSKIGFLKKSYAFKFLFVAFLGIHIPLIGILFFVLFSKNEYSSASLLIFALLMTLAATLITLIALNKLIKPILLASRSLIEYRNNRSHSHLPEGFTDEAGLLMKNIKKSIEETESFITEKQDLIYMLSHDLKNFAGNPQSIALLILEEKPSGPVQELAGLICKSTELQFRYIDNFIHLLKQQDDIFNIIPKSRTIAFSSILPLINEQVQQRLKDKNIKLDLEMTVSDATLKIDEGLLVQVIVNLISNAIKFSYSDSVIEMRILRKNANLILSVKDYGIGFKYPDQIEEIFRKFTKLSKLGTAHETSTGIGLYLCKKIIEKSGGKLTAKSEGENKGAEFIITFGL
jgi:signal transduction histidine kinase